MRDMNLKPCPFCGGTDFLVETYPLGEKYRTGIVCRTCLGGMDTMKSYPTSDEARSKAEEAWNKRAEPSRPHGQWIKAKDLSGEYYYCSECKEELPRVATESATWDNPYPTEYSIDTTDFCPHCGADMRQQEGGRTCR